MVILISSLNKTTCILKNGFTMDLMDLQYNTVHQEIKTAQILSKNQLLKFIQLTLGEFYKGEQKSH